MGFKWLRPALVVLAIGAGLAAFRFFEAPRLLAQALEWIRAAGATGAVVFFLLFVAATVLMLPASVLTLGAGLAWGPWWGLAIVLPSAVAAATSAFGLSRTVGRRWVEGRIVSHPRFRAIDEAVGQGGLKLVVLLRLSPLLPFNLLNPTLGLTRVSLRDFVLGSAVGMAPGALMYLYLGSLLTSASQLWSGERPAGGAVGLGLSAVGLVATVAVTVGITRAAGGALRRALEPGVER